MNKYNEVQLNSLRDKIQAEARKREQLAIAKKQKALEIKKRKQTIQNVLYFIFSMVTFSIAVVVALAFLVYFQ